MRDCLFFELFSMLGIHFKNHETNLNRLYIFEKVIDRERITFD